MTRTLSLPNRAVALAMAFALALACSVTCALAFASDAYAVSEGCYVSGQKYSGGKFTVQSGKATWAGGTDDRTLTLTNAVINAGHKDSGTGFDTGVYVTSGASSSWSAHTLNIVLVGDNTINVSTGAYGIYNACEDVTLNITGDGTLNIVGAGKQGINSRGKIVIGANVTVNGSSYGVVSKGQLKVTAGTVKVVSPQYNGLTSEYGEVYVKGGTVKVSNFDGHGIQAQRNNVVITNGKVSLTQVAGGTTNLAVAAGNGYAVKNKATCWGTIRGRLDGGAKFTTKSGNVFQVDPSHNGYVKIVKYAGSDMTVTLNTTSFGGQKYYINAVATKAFAKTGIKTISFGSYVKAIGPYAFYGCKNLKIVSFRKTSYSSMKIYGKAFTKAYQKPEVRVSSNAAASNLKKKLVKGGMAYPRMAVYR